MTKGLQIIKENKSLAEWSRQVEECRNSGLSMRSWCEQHQIAVSTFHYRPNNRIIYWDNLFENAESPIVKKGKHITIPSVLQENKKWVSSEKKKYSFVDPEIGHMAYAAQKANIKFSYLHIISDNLSKKYMFDLSNERKQKVLLSRKRLMQLIGKMILDSIPASATPTLPTQIILQRSQPIKLLQPRTPTNHISNNKRRASFWRTPSTCYLVPHYISKRAK